MENSSGPASRHFLQPPLKRNSPLHTISSAKADFLHLSDVEVLALIDFLKTLTGRAGEDFTYHFGGQKTDDTQTD